MSSYSFSDTAVRDLDEICDYIALQNTRAASQLFDYLRYAPRTNQTKM